MRGQSYKQERFIGFWRGEGDRPGWIRATGNQAVSRNECNQLAQMDFKGEYQVKDGKCYPLSFLDDHSRYLIGLWPLRSTAAEGVEGCLRGRFEQSGVPQSILMDHGTP